jgi:hypothetical protein
MRRTIAVLAMAVGLVCLSSANVLARGDHWSFIPSPPFELPSSLCGFPVQVTTTSDKEYAKTVFQSDTTLVLLVTGGLKTQFTNLDTGTSITVNDPGPGTIVIDLQTGVAQITGDGPWLLLFLPEDQPQFGVPGIMPIWGHFTETLDTTTNNVIALSFQGHTEDLCAELA